MYSLKIVIGVQSRYLVRPQLTPGYMTFSMTTYSDLGDAGIASMPVYVTYPLLCHYSLLLSNDFNGSL